MAPRLYCNPSSGNCYKVRLLASLLDISLDLVELDFFNHEHKSPQFLAINPKGEIPTLVIGDTILTDSSAILVYLAGTSPGRGTTSNGTRPSTYWSTNVVEQAQMVEWLAFTASYIEFGICKARAIVSFDWPAGASEQTIKQAQEKGVKSLGILEKRLAQNEWLALGRPTVADVAIFPYVALASMGGVSVEPFPSVKAWLDRVRSLPGFIPLAGLDQPRQKA